MEGFMLARRRCWGWTLAGDAQLQGGVGVDRCAEPLAAVVSGLQRGDQDVQVFKELGLEGGVGHWASTLGAGERAEGGSKVGRWKRPGIRVGLTGHSGSSYRPCCGSTGWRRRGRYTPTTSS